MEGYYTKVIYDWYNSEGRFIARKEYYPESAEDYNRVWDICATKPNEYKIVTCEYGFAWRNHKHD